MHHNATLPLAGGTPALAPEANAGASYLHAHFDPDQRKTIYEPFIPYEQTQSLLTVIAVSPPASYLGVAIELDHQPWFFVEACASANKSKDGITCDVHHGVDGNMNMTVQNHNGSEDLIVLSWKLVFDEHNRPVPGTDPQVVLPPENP